MQQAKRGLLIVGPQSHMDLREPLTQVAHALGYPILADPLSQLRAVEHDRSQVIMGYDAFLRLDEFAQRLQPDLIIRFGAMPTSKPVLTYLKRYPTCPLVVIDGNEGWEEPTQLASELIHIHPVAFCGAVLTNLLHVQEKQEQYQEYQEHQESQWLTEWQRLDEATRSTLATHMQQFPHLFEGRVFTELASLLPENATLFVGNSMPVRDLDTFFWGSDSRVHIMGNRGANGIDGVASSALGASAVSTNPTALVIGDLSCFDDICGLLGANLHSLNLTIILINNDG